MTDDGARARRMEATAGALPKLAGWVFLGTGAAMVVGGAVMVVDDPAGFALVAFGAVFMGAGWLARRVFAPPKGKKAVAVDLFDADIRQFYGGRGTRTQATIIHLDENATEAEIEAARQGWLREQWALRPDWVAGRIVAEDQRSGHWQEITAVVWGVFTLLALGAVLIWGDFAWLVFAGASLFTTAMVVIAVRRRLRMAKFAASHFAMAGTPAILGGKLEGEVETGVAPAVALADSFRLRLRCAHRWEETDRSGPNDSRRTRRHYDVLWEAEAHHPGHAAPGMRTYRVPVRFDLPADRPPATLGSPSEGIVWELAVTAAMPGVDYQATFVLPVLPPGAERLREV